MKPEVEIYDTTLRDGSQGEGINFSVMDKLRIAEKLDAFGIHYIEGGWPGSNPKDIEFFAEAQRRTFKNARLAAFGSTRRKGVPVEGDDQVRLLLGAQTPVVTIFGKTWLLHVKEVLGTTPEENLAMIGDTVRFLKDHGKYVIYDAEHACDGYKDDAAYAVATWQAAEKAGADFVVLCDTNGGTLPREVANITAVARGILKTRLGIHTHDDIGLGVANALVAVEAGATQVQGTINGYGERTGNCNLTSAIPNIALKLKKVCVAQESLARLRELSQFVDEIANVRHNPRQPWVGQSAFAHKGGMHVNAVKKVARSFEHVDPIVVGNRRRVLVSDLAGRSNIILKAPELGFRVTNDTPELKTILARIKELEREGFEFEAAEASLALLIRRELEHKELPFSVDEYDVSMHCDKKKPMLHGKKESICRATVRVRVDTQTALGKAEGDGPVNALDKALRAALVRFFPELKAVSLIDYKVRILDSRRIELLKVIRQAATKKDGVFHENIARAAGRLIKRGVGSAAKTRVLIESSNGKEEWGTVGVDYNIVEASLQALVDSMEYALTRK